MFWILSRGSQKRQYLLCWPNFVDPIFTSSWLPRYVISYYDFQLYNTLIFNTTSLETILICKSTDKSLKAMSWLCRLDLVVHNSFSSYLKYYYILCRYLSWWLIYINEDLPKVIVTNFGSLHLQETKFSLRFEQTGKICHLQGTNHAFGKRCHL